MQKVIVSLQTGIHKTVKSAAKVFHVKYGTFRNRYLGKHKPPQVAHKKQQLLEDTQEAALISWCKYRAKQGEALTRGALRRYITGLMGKTPGSKWVKRFLVKHADKLEARKARGLDLKRA
ncbi:hypothetical protein K439DRAFT_1365290 [Ramaria rubella]|nr:hypothetical protein K439DRAFT_1365290 [Ramaria rubella]